MNKLAEEEAKWGTPRDATVREIEGLVAEAWVETYTDTSAKQVQGEMQAGYVRYDGEHSSRHFSAHVPVHRQQSASPGEQ